MLNRSPELISRLVTADLVTYFNGRETARAPAHVHQKVEVQETSHIKSNVTFPRSKMSVTTKREYVPSKLGKIALGYTKGTGAWQAYIQWPNWLSQSIYEVESNPTFGGWMYNYRAYNIVSSNSEIITRVKSGDTGGMLELFRTRKASPFDRDQSGTSLLSVSSSSSSS